MSVVDDPHTTSFDRQDDQRVPGASPTVVIVGATSGFGEALARELATLGANIVVAGRDAERAAGIAQAIGTDHALGVAYDVRRQENIDALWASAVERFGTVDHWINNAGVGNSRDRLDNLPVEEITSVVATNLTGVLLGTRRALEGMLAQGGGRIWVTEGLGSNGPALAGAGPYGATKAGVTYAHRVLAKECRDTPVSVGFLRPGIMPTRVTLGEQASQQQMPRLARLLSDRPEVVARSFAPRILRADRNGQRITWLTPGRIVRNLLTSAFRAPTRRRKQ